jgi:uncharacterized delta-60 repeat protein
VTITCATSGATIRYTTDGSSPNGNSPVYLAPIPVAGNGKSMTVRAIAEKSGMSDSGIKTEAYTINYNQVSTPVMNPSGGTYNSDQTVSITCGTSGSVIRYTTDGSDPNGSSPVYSTPISVTGHGANVTIKAFAKKALMSDSTISTEAFFIQYDQAAMPAMNIVGATYDSDQNIVISCATSGAVIRYTTDGTAPNGTSPVYSTSVSVAGNGTTKTIKAFAEKAGMLDSGIKTEIYTIQYNQIVTPVINPGGGTYSSDQSVTITCSTSGATIRYTTDGSAPSGSSPAYSTPILIAGDGTNMTIKAFATKSGMPDSAIASEVYSIDYSQVSTPLLSPAGGAYNSDQSVTITCGTIGAAIHYTIDGSVPNAGSPLYSTPIPVAGHGTNKTIKAIAEKTLMADSTIKSESYIIQYDQVATPVINPAGGTYNSNQNVSITCSTSGATIRYTTDGSTPNSGSPAYSGSIPVAGNGTNMTIKAIAMKSGMLDSSITLENYSIQYDQVATPVINPAGGTYNSDQNVSITCSTGGATIRYTTDGSAPNGSSTVYSTPIQVAGHGTNTTVKAFAIKAGMLDSSIKTESFSIQYDQVATPVINPAGGSYNCDQSVTLTCTTAGATIRYTTDGTDPNGSSSVYGSAIPLAGHGVSVTMKAYATKAGMLDSSIKTEIYSVRYSTITSITSSTTNGIYGSGSNINVTIAFSAPVTLSGGTLDITLDTGAVVKIAAFGPAGSATGVYSVGSGESSNDLDSTGITLSGGTLRDNNNYDAIVALPSTTIKNGSDIIVDGIKPVITAFTLTSGSPTTSHFLAFNLNGSDSGVGITHWMVNETGTKPGAGDAGWVSVKPDTYKSSPGYGTKTVYAWAKDAASNVSDTAVGSHFDVVVEYNGSSPGTFEKNNVGDDSIKAGTVDYDDNIYVVGNKKNTTYDWSIIKLSPNRVEDTVNWNKQLDWYGGEDCIQGAIVDKSNNLYVGGWFTVGTDVKWGIIKYTSTGAEVWRHEWNSGNGDDEVQTMTIDPNDNIYVAGFITNASSNMDWWIKKYHTDGTEDTVNWNFGFDSGYGDDNIISIASDSYGNIYCAGRTMNSGGDSDWLVRKYTANGSLAWSKQYDRASRNDQANTITVDSNNNIYVAGYTTRPNGNIDWTIKKYDTNGNEDTANWNKIINYGSDDVPWGIDTDSNGNVCVGGRFDYADNEWVFIKFNSSGTEIYRDVITPNTGADWCRAIVVDSMNYVYGLGGMVRSGFGADWFIKKYAP